MYIASSDGVGATGTFITIDHVLKQIEGEDVVDIPGVIQSIRQQRMNMVDTVFPRCTSGSVYEWPYGIYLFHTPQKPLHKPLHTMT